MHQHSAPRPLPVRTSTAVAATPVPIVPERTLTGRFGPVHVRTTLHGAVTIERYEHERVVAKHRAEQLDHTRPLPKIRIWPEDRDSYYGL